MRCVSADVIVVAVSGIARLVGKGGEGNWCGRVF